MIVIIALFTVVLIVLNLYSGFKRSDLEGEVKELKNKLNSISADEFTLRIYDNNGKTTDLDANEIEVDKGYFRFSDSDGSIMMVIHEQHVKYIVRLRNGEEDIIQTEDRKVISFNDN